MKASKSSGQWLVVSGQLSVAEYISLWLLGVRRKKCEAHRLT